jgi:hypothetical protein
MMRTMMRAEVRAVVPTARAISWSPLVAAVACLLGVAALTRVGDGRPGGLELMAVSTLAAAVVLTLHDPAARLLAAVPVSAMARRLTRLCLALVPAAVAWLLADAVMPGDTASLADGAAALVLTGLAVATWLPAERDARVAAVVPPAWVVLHLVMGEGSNPLADAAGWWATQPLPVAALALVLIVSGRHR